MALSQTVHFYDYHIYCIQRGKLQAEATGSQGQKRRGRKRKQKRGRGVRNEKTEAKGVKREHSPETE